MGKDFWVQALMTNKSEKLSIEEMPFLTKSLKSKRALVMELDLRCLFRTWLGLGGLWLVWKWTMDCLVVENEMANFFWTKGKLFKNLNLMVLSRQREHGSHSFMQHIELVLRGAIRMHFCDIVM